jgi:hypothetical protein
MNLSTDGVRRRCAEDQGRVQKADRHEVGYGNQIVREEVMLNDRTQAFNVQGLRKPRRNSVKRFVGLSLAVGVPFTCMATSSGQAAPVSGAGAKLAPAAGIVSQVYWRQRHCWWRHGYRHCRW